MKLIIDISDDVYEHVKSTKTIETVDYDIVSLYRAMKNGTPIQDGEFLLTLMQSVMTPEQLKEVLQKMKEADNDT